VTKHKLRMNCTRQFCWNMKIEIVSCVTYRQCSTILCITPLAPNQALGAEQPNVLKLCQGPHLHIQKKTPLCFCSPNSLSYTSFSGSSDFAHQTSLSYIPLFQFSIFAHQTVFLLPISVLFPLGRWVVSRPTIAKLGNGYQVFEQKAKTQGCQCAIPCSQKTPDTHSLTQKVKTLGQKNTSENQHMR
jgi:hypothetical protein